MKATKKFVLLIHGGSGTILRSKMTPEREMQYSSSLSESLTQGYKILFSGGSALEAVISAIKSMEDCPLFNAGKGSVFTSEGTNEMDASIMDGKTLKAGSVAGIQRVKNPITAALKVLENTEHVMLIGKAADSFAGLNDCEMKEADYFFTKNRWDQLKRLQKTDLTALDHNTENLIDKLQEEKKYGTVGAVALDIYGNLAAGTSTGGLTNKKWGRVGDSSIIGAGTYANNNTCAVSCTGIGEFFMRTLAAYDVSALMEYKGIGVEEAAELVINKKIIELGGEGGLIAVDGKGNIAMPFSSEGMYRGVVREDGEVKVFMYRD